MRIVMVSHYFSTHKGGVEMVAEKLTSHIAASGEFHLDWCASDCSATPAVRAHMQPQPMRCWNGLEKYGFPWPVWRLSAWKHLRGLIRQADAVHIHDYIYLSSIGAFLLARRYRKPVVITQHIGLNPYRDLAQTIAFVGLRNTLGRFMLARADQTVFISRAILNVFKTHHWKNPPLCWQNGIEHQLFQPASPEARAQIRQRLTADDNKPILLFVGRFLEKKGLPLLRDLCAAMPEAQWWFAGWADADSEHHPQNWRLPQVRVFSGRDQSGMVELYQAADLLLLPSKGEGFPLVVQEAMACGTPVLASPEAVLDMVSRNAPVFSCPIIPLENVVARWREAISHALREGRSPATIQAILEFSRAQDSWEDCAARYMALYQQVAR